MSFVTNGVLDIALVLLLVLCFIAAALLAVVEVSLLRVRGTKVRIDARSGDRRAQDLERLLNDLPVVLNTVLFIVLLCQVGVATISGFLAQRWAGGLVVTGASLVLSLLLFLYAESIPKTLAMKNPYRWALRSARGLRLLVRMFNPIVRRLVSFANWQIPSVAHSSDPVTEGELRMLARLSAQSPLAGTIGIADAELVERSFVFGDQTVGDIMVPRTDIVSVSADANVDDALLVAIEAGHRRLPALGTDIDDVIGFVRLRDLAAAARSQPSQLVETVAKRVLSCRPTEPIADLMERMRTSGTWLAIVQDETAGTVGLATVEDLVAELMGQIEEDPVVRPRPSH